MRYLTARCRVVAAWCVAHVQHAEPSACTVGSLAVERDPLAESFAWSDAVLGPNVNGVSDAMACERGGVRGCG